MKVTARVAFLLALLVGGLCGCERNVSGPTPPASSTRPAPTLGNLSPAFYVADITLSGFVFETTPDGKRPITGVDVTNGEGDNALTDANGFYSLGPVWVCPCRAEPWVESGTTFLWVSKDGYGDPPGTPASVFWRGTPPPGTRDVKIDGDTRFDIELVRR